MKTLNPYQIKWSIVTINGKLTKKIASKASKLGYMSMNGALARHSGNEEILTQEEAKLISFLKSENKEGTATIITDKQFGLSVTTFGVAANVDVPLKNALILKDGTRTMIVPVTKWQIRHTVNF